MPDNPSDSDKSPPRNPYNEEEAARRRREANRRARNAPERPLAGAPDSDRPARRPGRAGPEKYRGVEYSVAKHGEGAWLWKLRTPGETGAPAPSGTVRGRQNDAIEAAHRAIDKVLGTRRK